MTSNPLANLKFEGSSDFVKFKADHPVKLRVLSVDPLIHDNTYTDPKTGEVSVNTKYAFAVWNYGEERAMILDASPTIAKEIHRFHTDDEYGTDVTQIDLRITPTGEMLERRYSVDVLPKAQTLGAERRKLVQELDKKLEGIIKNGIRAEEYNQGARTEKDKARDIADKLRQPDTVHDVDENEPIDLKDIPFG